MMKKIILIGIIALLASCSYLKETIKIDEVVVGKKRFDKSSNPAEKFLIRDELSQKKIVLENVLVKNIIPSNNVDYDFCILADVITSEGNVECYIYSKDIDDISELIKGKTRISVKGDFGRFFTLLDSYYTKIDVLKASIDIVGTN